MDKQELLELLLEALKGITYHDGLVMDLADVFAKSGREAQFLPTFIIRLKELKAFRHKAVSMKPNDFENLSNVNGLYSMHIKKKGINYRIVYTFMAGDIVLLHGFHERAGKRKTNYSTAIATSNVRKHEVEESL